MNEEPPKVICSWRSHASARFAAIGRQQYCLFSSVVCIVSIFPVTTCNFYIFSIVSFQYAAVSLSLLCWEVLRLCRTQLGNTSTHRKHQVEQLTPKLREYIAARFSEVLRLDLLDPCVTTFAYICNSFAYISYIFISCHSRIILPHFMDWPADARDASRPRACVHHCVNLGESILIWM